MSYIFGNTICLHCQMDTRVLMEINDQKEDFYLIGQDAPFSSHKEEATCDYCQRTFSVNVLVLNGVLSHLLNNKQQYQFENGELKLTQAKKEEGIQNEKKHKVKQFTYTYTDDFANHPYESGKTLSLQDENWTISSIYKKENTEKDITQRIYQENRLEYWYKVQNEQGDEKWLWVVDLPKENAILTMEKPVLKEQDELIDVTESGFKSTLIFDQTVSEKFNVKGFQHYTGVQLLVYNEIGLLEVDIFEDNIDLAMSVLDDTFSF